MGVVLFGFSALVVLLLLDDWISRPDMRGFDPHGLGTREAQMWRSYYEHRWPNLAVQTLSLSRLEFGFSRLASARMAWHASMAALYFRRDGNDPRCLPHLEQYYRIILDRTRAGFDPVRAAELELRWWRQRRERLGPDEYGETIAELIGEVYGVPVETVRDMACGRAQAMAYRDARGLNGMNDAEWNKVANLLREAYAQGSNGGHE